MGFLAPHVCVGARPMDSRKAGISLPAASVGPSQWSLDDDPRRLGALSDTLLFVPAPERRMSACRRAPRDDKPVALKVLNNALSDDVRHCLRCLGFREPRIAGQRHSDADHQVSWIGRGELVGVRHAADDSREWRT
jgi:hypothetical protein